jgi:hypothetical protein
MYHKKRCAIFNLARRLCAQDRTETFAQLLAWLNQQGFTTDYGSAYTHPRGAASAVRAAYWYVRDELGLGDAGAAPIAVAFTNAIGEYAYE